MKSFIPVGVNALIGMVTLFSISPSWAAQMMAMSQNKDVIAEFTVPVRLSSLNRGIHSGKVECIAMQKASNDPNGLGSGNATFGINSSDGSFNGNVKVSVVRGKGVTDMQLAPELQYACILYLSPEAVSGAHTWVRPSMETKDDMYRGSSVTWTVSGNIPASK